MIPQLGTESNLIFKEFLDNAEKSSQNNLVSLGKLTLESGMHPKTLDQMLTLFELFITRGKQAFSENYISLKSDLYF
jgi:hypothetical protein